MQTQFASKEEFVEDLTDYVSTSINGFDREWVKRILNAKFGDRIMIETDGQELPNDWLELTPPRPEPGIPDEPSDEFEDIDLKKDLTC